MENNTKIISLIAENLQLQATQVEATVSMLADGATIPFISRYRKEKTGGLDEVQIADIKEQNDKFSELEQRKKTILLTIEEQEKLTDELRDRIVNCWNASELEDIYLPYKPHRRTRADMARERGLESLAKMLMKQQDYLDVENISARFINAEVHTAEEALQGARDIMAEWMAETEAARNAIRREFSYTALISSKLVKGKEEEAANYQDYFDFSEKLSRCTSHRLLAIRRAEKEGFLRVDISPDTEKCLERLQRIFVRADNPASNQVYKAMVDSYKRLLKPAIETEFAAQSKEKADAEAIRVFAENVRQLLLAPPLGQKRVLALDPGFRTGCKTVCLDAQGNLLHNETIYPHPPKAEQAKAMRTLQKLVEAYQIEAIAIGNGTASRETERFVANTRFDRQVQVFVVSENGASVYSASKTARDEFPEYDVTVRGAVSIGRRLMDPLAELVKIDPKSIGVGQYQHDVDQTRLKESLTQTVESVVNKVGVDVNTASMHLLTYISGLGPTLAQNIVDYRAANGAFPSRKALLKVPKMGAKTYEQAAGFLRIAGAENPLDNSAVHPESYTIVERMAADLHSTVSDLMSNGDLRQQVRLNDYLTDKVGLPTLTDIMKELDKPGRDPRSRIQVFEFDNSVHTMDDLRLEMRLPGIVTNLTNFGAFVDIGLHENGLVHISEIADHRISSPAEVLSLHQHVRVRVIGIDISRKRIQLSLRDV